MLSSPPPMRIRLPAQPTSSTYFQGALGDSVLIQTQARCCHLSALLTSRWEKYKDVWSPTWKKRIIKHPSSWCYEIAGWIHFWETAADVWGLILQPSLRNSDFTANVNRGLMAKPKGSIFCFLMNKFWNTINSNADPGALSQFLINCHSWNVSKP